MLVLVYWCVHDYVSVIDYVSVCVRGTMRACVHVCVRVCVRECMRVCVCLHGFTRLSERTFELRTCE